MNTRPLTLIPAIFVIVLLVGWTASPAAHAMTVAQTTTCQAFSKNIQIGQQDSGSSTDVGSLQQFLADEGYFNTTNLGSGHFGPLTLKAVQNFQKAHGVSATGFVGPLTRAAIAKIQKTDCGISVAAPNLYSLSPDSGSIGSEVSIRGFGFSKSNTVLIDGMVAARDVPITSSMAISCTTDPSCHGGINQTIVFTMPDSVSPNCPVGSMCPLYMRMLTPGKVTISVRNDSETSTGLSFTITK